MLLETTQHTLSIMEYVQIIQNLVESLHKEDSSGHDWFHIKRVYDMAMHLQSIEGGDKEIIQLAALLHDISDHKLNGGKLNQGGKVAVELLTKHHYPIEKAMEVMRIVDAVSYKGAQVADDMLTIEGKIVQDADRLDAIGAIGIARAFAFGGSRNRAMYIPNMPPVLHDSFENYANAKSHTINHFYEKLLLLKDRLHTKTAQKIGTERHQFMELYLNQFYTEWDAKYE